MAHWTDYLDRDGPDGAYLSWSKVEPRVGISRTTAWRLQKRSDFPKPYVVSPGRVAYRESEVEAWKASRAHRGATTPRNVAASVTSAAEASTATPALPEPASWSPLASGPEALMMEAPPQKVQPASNAPRRGSRARSRETAGDQMKFEF